MSSKQNRFWVIFDTGTFPDYSQDVHDILALPQGAIIRYEYREKYLTKEALLYSLNPDYAPSLVLLAYAQLNDYTRGDEAPRSSTPLETTISRMLWCPTRLASMQLIPPRNGEDFYFFLKLLGYPKPDDTRFMEIIQPLINAGEVPFGKWVAISEQTSCLKVLTEGNDQDNWQKIVQRLAEPPMQFAGDVFWRLGGIYKGDTPRRLSTSYIERNRNVGGNQYTTEVESCYRMSELSHCTIDVIRYEPSGAALQRMASGTPYAKIDLSVSKDGPLDIVGNHVALHLEQYGEKRFAVQSNVSLGTGIRQSIVFLRSGKHSNDWPLGPNLSLTFIVFKPLWKRILLPILYPLAGVFTLLGATLVKTNLALGSLFVVLGLLLGGLAYMIQTGKFGMKGSVALIFLFSIVLFV